MSRIMTLVDFEVATLRDIDLWPKTPSSAPPPKPPLSALHQRRWEAAKLMIETMIERASTEKAKLMFDDQIIELQHVKIKDDQIIVDNGGGCYTLLFEANPDWDHGLNDKISVFRAEMRKRFKLIKEIPW